MKENILLILSLKLSYKSTVSIFKIFFYSVGIETTSFGERIKLFHLKFEVFEGCWGKFKVL